MIIFILSLCFIFVYDMFLFWSLYNWNKIADKSSYGIEPLNVSVAVVIAARNEEDNLPFLLQSLAIQDYPKENFQIVISDDHSQDRTKEVVENFVAENKFLNCSYYDSPKQSKKEAIAFAISKTDAEFILTTDADTFMGREWISSMVKEYTDTGNLMVCGPVKLKGSSHLMNKIQVAEFAGLSGIGAAGIESHLPMFCNGANLGFSRKIFYESGGYENSKSFSGDDTQLMLKIHKSHPGKISFLKDSRAIVQTNVVTAKNGFIAQRRRWASKIPNTLSAFTIFIAFIAWFVHSFLLIQLFTFFIQFNFLRLFLPLSMIVIPEIIFLKSVGKFFDLKIELWLMIIAQPFYSLYIVFVGLFSPVGSYQWKGRKLK